MKSFVGDIRSFFNHMYEDYVNPKMFKYIDKEKMEEEYTLGVLKSMQEWNVFIKTIPKEDRESKEECLEIHGGILHTIIDNNINFWFNELNGEELCDADQDVLIFVDRLTKKFLI